MSITPGNVGTATTLDDIAGVTDGSSAATGKIGEYQQSTVLTNTAVGSTGTFINATSIVTLPAGDWDLTAFVGLSSNGTATTITGYEVGISTVATANSFTDSVEGDNYVLCPLGSTGPATNSTRTMAVPNYRVNISTATTYYLKLKVTFSAGSPVYKCRLSARRAR